MLPRANLARPWRALVAALRAPPAAARFAPAAARAPLRIVRTSAWPRDAAVLRGSSSKPAPAAAPRTAKDVAADELSKESVETSRFFPHPLWSNEYIDDVRITHLEPERVVDRLAMWTVRVMRFNFDWMSGYSRGPVDENMWLRRIIFLETVAGVPGSVAGTLRHLKSLRQMKRDHGWIHTLIQEAENERMHLMTAIHLYQPSRAFRAVVWLTQGIFFNFFFLAYLVSPRFCHRFVGYLEEEAVKTYTRCLSEIDKGNLPKWNALPAPPVAKKYWNMKEGSTIRDVIAVIRADEAHHRDVNHTFASLKGSEPNPFDARP